MKIDFHNNLPLPMTILEPMVLPLQHLIVQQVENLRGPIRGTGDLWMEVIFNPPVSPEAFFLTFVVVSFSSRYLVDGRQFYLTTWRVRWATGHLA
jgi:hypothetical protein